MQKDFENRAFEGVKVLQKSVVVEACIVTVWGVGMLGGG